MSASDLPAFTIPDEWQEDSHELARERREKQALERQLADARYECRKIEVLQQRSDDLQVRHHKEATAREEAEAAQHKAEKFAESVAEWDRALQEKNQRLEARVEGLEKEVKSAQIKQANAETQNKDLQDALAKATKKLAEVQREAQRLTDEAERLAGELHEQRSHYVMMRDRFDGEQALARRKTEELEAMQKRVEELTDVLDRDKHLHSQIGDEEERYLSLFFPYVVLISIQALLDHVPLSCSS